MAVQLDQLPECAQSARSVQQVRPSVALAAVAALRWTRMPSKPAAPAFALRAIDCGLFHPSGPAAEAAPVDSEPRSAPMPIVVHEPLTHEQARGIRADKSVGHAQTNQSRDRRRQLQTQSPARLWAVAATANTVAATANARARRRPAMDSLRASVGTASGSVQRARRQPVRIEVRWTAGGA
jgi:hypothetical protein